MYLLFKKYKIFPGLLLFILLSSISGKAQNNPCGIKAIFSNEKDTIVTNGITINYTNISQNATSIRWLRDGNPYYYLTVPNTFQLTTSSVGIHKIQLVIGVNQGIATGFYLLKLDKTGTVLWTKLMQKKALGTIKGRPVAIGTYYYFFKIKNPTDTAFKQKSGAITLLR